MSKIKVVDYGHINWGPYVMRTNLPNYVIKKLKSEGVKAKESYNRSLAGHLNHQFLYPVKFQQWFYSEIQPILQAYRQGHCKYHGLKELNIEFQADDLWVNFMQAGDFNPIHTHGGDYSFVVFVDTPKLLEQERKAFQGTSAKPGDLQFEYTCQAKPRWATTGVAIQPKPGDMYMFPALLQHWVLPFKSKCTRISVSGNINIINKAELPNDYF